MQKFTDKDITLIESEHRYELHSDPGFEFTSCTTFVKYFFSPFDKIGVANKLTATHPKYNHLTPQELVGQWDEIAEEGTLIHAEVEDYINDRTDPNHVKSKVAVDWIKKYLLETDRYELFSEVIVYSKELSLAGTIDLLIHDKINDAYKILDWKTNKRIDTRSFNNKVGHHKATRNLMDCNYYHYSVQLSLYRYILETYYGLTVTGTAISHLMNSDMKIYKTAYNFDEIKKMLRADREFLKEKNENSLTLEYA